MRVPKRVAMAKKEIFFDGVSYAISYEFLNLEAEKTLVFLHGWGSSKTIMKQAFGTTLPKYKHLYIDMPGFGSSSIEKPLNTHDYASIMALLFEALGIEPYAIVGHSFGGKVATLLEPKRMILLSSAGILVSKSLSVRAKIAFFKTFKSFVPKRFFYLFASKDVAGMSQVMYETLKNVVNENFKEIFGASKAKTAIFWGIDDDATPLSSGRMIHQLISNSTFFPLEGGHFFFLEKAKTIEQKLFELDY